MSSYSFSSSRYHRATLTTPLFHFVIHALPPRLLRSVVQPTLNVLYWFRWQLARPLYIPLFPKWTPHIPLPGVKHLTYLTYGDVLLVLPLVVLLLAGLYYCFYAPNVQTSGQMASYAIILCFLTANKSCSIFSLVLGIPFERMLGFHKLAALGALVLGATHTYLVFQREDASTIVGFATRDANNALGSLIILCLVGLAMTSFLPILRRWNYDIWLYVHIGLGIGIALPWAVHSVNLVWIPLFWFLLDWMVRYGIMVSCRYRTTTQARLTLIQKDVVEIKFLKPTGLDYNAGQFLRIAIPKLSVFQFHPFSISSAPHEEYVTLHVRALGNWTQQLVTLAQNTNQGRPHHTIWIEGPYGASSVDLNSPRYGMILLVCGGIGVTHCRSVFRSLVHDNESQWKDASSSLQTIRLVWAVRDYDLVQNLPLYENTTTNNNKNINQAVKLAPVQVVKDDVETTETVTEPTPSLQQTKQRQPMVVQTEVYVTGSCSSCTVVDAAERGEIGTGSHPHPHPSLIIHHQKRPDLHAIFSEMAQKAMDKGITHIAVLGCGPRPLMESLQETCRQHSKSVVFGGVCQKGVSFDLHEEVFEF